MTRHLMRLIWNRKRHNLLLAVEIFLSFVVVVAVAAVALNYLQNWRRDMGYRIENVWRIEISSPVLDPARDQETADTLNQLYATARSLPGVESAAAISIAPYNAGSNRRTRRQARRGGELQVDTNAATDELATVMTLDLTAGRWFSREDDTATVRPIVVAERTARAFFGDADPIGQLLVNAVSPGAVQESERVVGVIKDFRKDGELSTPRHYMFQRIRPDRTTEIVRRAVNEAMMVRVVPGTPADFEETIAKSLQPLARDWTFAVAPLSADRDARLRTDLILVAAPTIVAAFLLVMVGLGLTGIVWQNVTERIREFGLRRAQGAAAADIRRQVLIELACIASIALLPGAALAAQIPFLPVPWTIPGGVFLAAVAVSIVSMYVVVLVCGWYPSRLATRIQPAEALHYE